MRACLLIDYQNIHLTGHGAFCPNGVPRHESLIHPAAYAEQVQATRNQRRSAVQIEKIIAFRGMPAQKQEQKAYARSQAQRSEWTRSPRVEVVLRPLRYPHNWPSTAAQEKGVDVMLAVELIEQARNGNWDVVIMASHDTDLEPAVEFAERVSSAVIETTGWKGRKRLRGGRSDRWHTFLDDAAFVRSQDRKDYT